MPHARLGHLYTDSSILTVLGRTYPNVPEPKATALGHSTWKRWRGDVRVGSELQGLSHIQRSLLPAVATCELLITLFRSIEKWEVLATRMSLGGEAP